MRPPTRERSVAEKDRDAARYRGRAPEVAAESGEFKEWCEEQYADRVHSALLEKQWFSKVDALELFTNFWSLAITL